MNKSELLDWLQAEKQPGEPWQNRIVETSPWITQM